MNKTPRSNAPNMEKKECPSCAMPVDKDADVCPICGYEFPKQSRALQVAAIIMIILMVLYFVL